MFFPVAAMGSARFRPRLFLAERPPQTSSSVLHRNAADRFGMHSESQLTHSVALPAVSNDQNGSNSPPKTRHPSKKDPGRGAQNMGRAIEVLRTELPFFFERGLEDWSIYDEDVHLVEPHHYRFYIHGRNMYRWFLGGARHVLRWYFSDISLQIKGIHQLPSSSNSSGTEPEASSDFPRQLTIRWSVEGTPKTSILKQNLLQFLQRVTNVSGLPPSVTQQQQKTPSSPPDGYVVKSVYEGMFVYKFNGDGMIIEHSIENIVPAPKKFAPLMAIGWWQQRGKVALE